MESLSRELRNPTEFQVDKLALCIASLSPKPSGVILAFVMRVPNNPDHCNDHIYVTVEAIALLGHVTADEEAPNIGFSHFD
jgi:hypothetical protein